MRLIVADAYGSGYLDSDEHGRRELSADAWTEVDVRDTVHAGDAGAHVRYREGGKEVDVAAGDTYHIEYASEDVIDVRSATPAAEEIAEAMAGIGTDEDRIYRALQTAPHDHSRQAWIDQLRFTFEQKTGHSLDEALNDELSGAELQKALDLLR